MKRRAFVQALIATGAGAAIRPAAAQASMSASPDAPVGLSGADGYRLVKDWDFRRVIRSASTLREEFHTRYVYANGTLDHLNDEWSRYRDDDNHVLGPEGLALVAHANGPLRAGNVESGMLRSRWSGRYGVFESRMKVPRGRGTWPAFWLNPEDGRWPPEIDVVEIVDNGRDDTARSFHFLHGIGAEATARSSKLTADHSYRPGFDYADDFHVFAAEWTPAGVRHFVDGVVVHDQPYRWVHDDGADAGAAHVLLNLAIGGRWPGPPTPTALPARLLVDWVRVWQR